MLTFDPPELEQQLKNALTGFASTPDFWPEQLQGDFFDPTSEDFDPSDFEEQLVTPETECSFTLPYASLDYRINYQQFIDILLEAQNSRLEENVEVWSQNRYLIRVTGEHTKALYLLDRHFDHAEAAGIAGLFAQSISVQGYEITCSLTRGITLFGILITARGDYEKYFPPISDEEMFIEVSFSDATPELTVRNIVEAYMFELSTSHNIHLTKEPRLTWEEYSEIAEYWATKGEENATAPAPLRFRPLLTGKGMHGILELYNKAGSVQSPDVAVLFYAKVIEYASPTILRQNLTTTVQNKLSSPRAMNPDARFILELEGTFKENRTYNKKDKETIALTVEQCCDANELRRVAPPFLEKLTPLTDSSGKKERTLAVREFAFALAATRNSIAHAKANYEPTGEECPESQLLQFVECAELAAQQVVRWFARCPEHSRVL